MSDNPSSGRDDKQFRQIDDVIDYQNQDLARTYGFTKTEGEISISSEEFERQHQELMAVVLGCTRGSRCCRSLLRKPFFRLGCSYLSWGRHC